MTLLETLGFGPAAQPAPDDFSGDGMSDLLLLSQNGTPVEWAMDGSTVTAMQNLTYQGSAAVVPSNWSIAGIGDF